MTVDNLIILLDFENLKRIETGLIEELEGNYEHTARYLLGRLNDNSSLVLSGLKLLTIRSQWDTDGVLHLLNKYGVEYASTEEEIWHIE